MIYPYPDLDIPFFWQLDDMKSSIFTLSKVKIDAFDIDKMLYGIIIDLKFIWQLILWKLEYMLYIKYKWLFLKLIKCCMGFLFFLVEIHLVYLYNTYRERLLEKQWLLWNKINAEALIFFHCRWWLVLFAFFYNNQCYF